MITNSEIADSLDTRVIVGSFYPHGVDDNLWLVLAVASNHRKLMVDTGYHLFWATELESDLMRNKNYKNHYNLKNISPVIHRLRQEYGVRQVIPESQESKQWRKIKNYCKLRLSIARKQQREMTAADWDKMERLLQAASK